MVLVFKTSIKNKKEVQQITPTLDSAIENGKWNFDLNDCDKILRVVTNKNISHNIITTLLSQGFDCEELQ